MASGAYNTNVFVNCPFDEQYRDIFRAIVFTVIECGFSVRCALELDDATQVRIKKIENLVKRSRYGIHDLSRTELDSTSGLPRFNMPLESGLFLGAKCFGDTTQKRKSAMILDCERYRYQKFISDIAGQDIKSHENDYRITIVLVRDWLSAQSRRKSLPGGQRITNNYEEFRLMLPSICNELKFDPEDQLPFNDYTNAVRYWLRD